MASVSFVAADVRPLPGALVERFTADETLTPGDAVYLKSDGDVALADADALVTAIGIGIVVSGPEGKLSFAAGDRVDVVTLGPVAGFSGMTPGTVLYSSVTAGDISDARPAGSSGDFAYVLGSARNANVIFVLPFTDNIAAL